VGRQRRLSTRSLKCPKGSKRGDSESDHSQAWNPLKVTEVARSHSVTQLQSASPDDQVPERDVHSPGGLLGANPGDDLCRRLRNRMDRDLRFEFVEELAALTTPLRSSGSVDSVSQFSHRQRRDDDGKVTNGRTDSPNCFGGRDLTAFNSDQRAGIKD